jgi:zinc protease
LQVLADILGGGNSSRLYQALVVEGRLASSASTGYSASDRDLSTFGFYVTPLNGTTLEKVEAAVDAEIAKILADGVTDEELANAKQRLIAEAVYARDSHRWAANALGGALAIGMTVEQVESWPERIRAVTPEEIRAAAHHVFEARRSVTAVLVPEEPERKSQ